MADVRQFTIRELAEACRGALTDPRRGDGLISRVASIEDTDAEADAVTWISEPRFAGRLAATRAGAVIARRDVVRNDPRGIAVDDPESAVADVLDLFCVPPVGPAVGVHPAAVVAEDATLGRDVAIGPHAVVLARVSIGDGTIIHDGVSIGADVRIGRDCRIHARCVIGDRCRLGDRVIVHPGAVIGADGFGYLYRDGRHRKIAQLGSVVIEDDVEIGANTCIDRAKLGVTRIGRGSKIDNLVQLAHNVQLGPLCIITAQCGLSGSARLGTGVVLGGQSGTVHGVSIGDGARLAARSVAWHDIPAGMAVSGTPSRDNMTELRERARVRRLPELFDQVKELTRRVAQLENATDDRNAD